MKLEIDTITYDLNETWKISGATHSDKRFIYLKLSDEEVTGVGEYSYSSLVNPDIDLLNFQLEQINKQLENKVFESYMDFYIFLGALEIEDRALSFAIDSAFLDFASQMVEESKSTILGSHHNSSIETMFSIPIFDSHEEFLKSESRYPKDSFLKVKVSKESIKGQLAILKEIERPFILDANQSFGEDLDFLVKSLEGIDHRQILFFEQPFAKDCINVNKLFMNRKERPALVLDESFSTHTYLDHFKEYCDGLVIKSSKSGSYIQMMKQLKEIKDNDLMAILGCMVESSIGISSLLPVTYGFDYLDLDGFSKVKGEVNPRVILQGKNVVLSNLH